MKAKTSTQLLEEIKAKQQTQSDLRTNRLETEAERTKAETARQRVSYNALTQRDAKAVKSMEEAETALGKFEQRLKSIDAALAEGDQRIADLTDEYNDTLDEERWQEHVIIPLTREIKENAPRIELHFFGGEGPVEPFVPLLRRHITALGKISSMLIHRSIEHNNFVMLFKRWQDSQLHELFRDSNRVYYKPEIREKLEGHYVPMLEQEFKLIVARREAKRAIVKQAS